MLPSDSLTPRHPHEPHWTPGNWPPAVLHTLLAIKWGNFAHNGSAPIFSSVAVLEKFGLITYNNNAPVAYVWELTQIGNLHVANLCALAVAEVPESPDEKLHRLVAEAIVVLAASGQNVSLSLDLTTALGAVRSKQ